MSLEIFLLPVNNSYPLKKQHNQEDQEQVQKLYWIKAHNLLKQQSEKSATGDGCCRKLDTTIQELSH